MARARGREYIGRASRQSSQPPAAEERLVSLDSRRTQRLACTRTLVALLVALFFAVGAGPVFAVDYVRDVRPILAGKCFACHGPDDGARQAGLRLDSREGATAALESGLHAITPGKPDESELIARVTSADAETAMPPGDDPSK